MAVHRTLHTDKTDLALKFKCLRCVRCKNILKVLASDTATGNGCLNVAATLQLIVMWALHIALLVTVLKRPLARAPACSFCPPKKSSTYVEKEHRCFILRFTCMRYTCKNHMQKAKSTSISSLGRLFTWPRCLLAPCTCFTPNVHTHPYIPCHSRLPWIHRIHTSVPSEGMSPHGLESCAVAGNRCPFELKYISISQYPVRVQDAQRTAGESEGMQNS